MINSVVNIGYSLVLIVQCCFTIHSAVKGEDLPPACNGPRRPRG
jgi:hypothetical protein